MTTVTASTLRSPSLCFQSIRSRFPTSTTSPAGLLFSKVIKRLLLPEMQCPEGKSRGSSSASWKLNAFPDWPLMAVMVEHVANQRDYVVHKSIWHLSDQTMKNVYTMYIMFTVWGCCFFGSTKDPFYDSEEYRKDGGDGSVHWIYERQEDIEESARAELWREELIEEIEQKVGGLRELEEARKEEELVK